MAFRFVHTADLHLDSPLRSLAARDANMADAVRTATREAFRRTVDLCLSEQVHALLIAGDLYDGKQQSMQTAVFLRKQLERLDEQGIRTFIIRGNHDAESRITRELTFPQSVRVFTGRGEVEAFEIEGETIAVHGVSFAKPVAPESLLDKFRAPKEGALNIGLLHTSLNGSPHHDVYAPCSEADLRAHGFDYWALGHIHVRSQSTVAGTTIVMPGIPQGRDMGEGGAKSVSLVELSADSVHVDERNVAPIRFERLGLEMSVIENRAMLRDAALQAVSRLRETTGGQALIVRFDLQGACSWRRMLTNELDLVLEDLRLDLESLNQVYLEKIDLRGLSEGPTVQVEGPVEELADIIDTQVLQSHAFEVEAGELSASILRTLPRSVREALGEDETLVTRLAESGGRRVLDALAQGLSSEGKS